LIVKESDNNVKLIVLDRLIAMKVKHVDLHFVNLVLMIKIFTSTKLLGEHKNGTISIIINSSKFCLSLILLLTKLAFFFYLWHWNQIKLLVLLLSFVTTLFVR
jgi:hypothetical protein